MLRLWYIWTFSFFLPFLYLGQSQIANYVSNGSFESLNTNSLSSYYNAVNYWQPIDTNKFADFLATLLQPIANAPHAGSTFQYPKTGNNYIGSTLFCPTCTGNARGYPRNRLKQTLSANVTYCVKYFISIANMSTCGMDAIGAYFGNSTLDTINYCNIPLTYLTPQVQNPTGNIIIDTLNWVAITGTFVANGTEKYMVLGNFKSNATTNTIAINTSSVVAGTDVCFDDVSVIELNLPAYAGPDKSVIPGDSVFIGREPDFAIDSGCTWFKLPNLTTAIDTISGLWVKPTVTTAYVVRQILDCSSEKWDTVMVYINPVGLEKLKLLSEEVKIYPVPAKDFVELSVPNIDSWKDFRILAIYNNLGQIIREEEINFKGGNVSINVSDLPAGVYFMKLTNSENEGFSKKLIIVK